MGIESVKLYIAYCDNKGCLSSVEDRNTTAQKLLNFIQQGSEPWQVIEGKLLCHFCVNQIEQERIREQEEKEYQLSSDCLNAKSHYTNWLKDQGYGGYLPYILPKLEIIQHDNDSAIPLQFYLNKIKLDKSEQGFRDKHFHILHQLWLEANEKWSRRSKK